MSGLLAEAAEKMKPVDLDGSEPHQGQTKSPFPQLNLAGQDVATVASAAKAFLKELDEPLLTRALYPAFLAAARQFRTG